MVFNEIEQLRKEGQYEDAAYAYASEIRNGNMSSGALAGYTQCLRYLGRFKEAAVFIEKFYPEPEKQTQWMKNEKAWIIYYLYVKPYTIKDVAVFYRQAEEIFRLSDDRLTLKLTAFKVTDVLSKDSNPDYELIIKWLKAIEFVAQDKGAKNDVKKKSDKIKWFFKITKALEKLGWYKECRDECNRGGIQYRRNFVLRSRALRCLLKLDDVNEETLYKELEILNKIRKEWFVFYPVAEYMYNTDRLDKAEKHIIQAARCKSKISHMRNVFILWSRILRDMGEDKNVYRLPILYCLYRLEEDGVEPGEDVKNAVKEFKLGRIKNYSEYAEPYESFLEERSELYPELNETPRKGKVLEGVYSGRVKNIREKFGFIQSNDGEDYFFSKDYSYESISLNDRVRFRLREAFDCKKKILSVEAFDVIPATR
ncbi:MAG: hypothetical protein ACOCSE_00785 [Chitinivibrionales bacterium]